MRGVIQCEELKHERGHSMRGVGSLRVQSWLAGGEVGGAVYFTTPLLIDREKVIHELKT